jgi:hypothetical protein
VEQSFIFRCSRLLRINEVPVVHALSRTPALHFIYKHQNNEHKGYSSLAIGFPFINFLQSNTKMKKRKAEEESQEQNQKEVKKVKESKKHEEKTEKSNKSSKPKKNKKHETKIVEDNENLKEINTEKIPDFDPSNIESLLAHSNWKKLKVSCRVWKTECSR